MSIFEKISTFVVKKVAKRTAEEIFIETYSKFQEKKNEKSVAQNKNDNNILIKSSTSRSNKNKEL